MLKFEGKKWLCAMLAAVMIAASPLNGILTVFAEPDEDEEVYDEAEYNDEEVYGFDDPNEDDLYNDPDENIDDVVVDEYIEEDVEAYDDYTEATGVYDDQGDESEEDTDTDTEKTDSDNQKSMGESSVAELDKLACRQRQQEYRSCFMQQAATRRRTASIFPLPIWSMTKRAVFGLP